MHWVTYQWQKHSRKRDYMQLRKTLLTMLACICLALGLVGCSNATTDSSLKDLNLKEEEVNAINEVDFESISLEELLELLNKFPSGEFELAIAKLANDSDSDVHYWLLQKPGLRKETLFYILNDPNVKDIHYYGVVSSIHDRIAENDFSKNELKKLLKIAEKEDNHDILWSLLDEETFDLDSKIDVFESVNSQLINVDKDNLRQRFYSWVLKDIQSVKDQQKVISFIMETESNVFLADFLDVVGNDIDDDVLFGIIRSDLCAPQIHRLYLNALYPILFDKVSDQKFCNEYEAILEELSGQKQKSLKHLYIDAKHAYQDMMNKANSVKGNNLK